MKEIKTILEKYEKFQALGLKMAVAIVVSIEGSSYRRLGARMLIAENGQWVGGVSGGCLEGDLLRKARAAIYQQRSRTVVYDTREDDYHQIGIGLGCRGLIECLIVPITAAENPLKLLRECSQSDQIQLLISSIENPIDNDFPAGKSLIYSIKNLPYFLKHPIIKKAIENCFLEQQSSSLVIPSPKGKIRMLLEYLSPPIHLVIFGKNYDIFPLIEISTILGWKITISASGNELKKKFINSNFQVQRLRPNFAANHRTALVFMSHDYKTDLKNLLLHCHSKAAYMGLLGPRKRGQRLISELKTQQKKLPSNWTDKLHYPIGLDLGSESPEEIALSIVSEINAFFARRTGQPLRQRERPIHE